MVIAYTSFVESFPASFEIGPAKKKFYIHDALLEQHFEPLWNFRNSGIRKKQAEVFGNIEEETFVRFVEYAYTGSYSVPQPVPFPVVSEAESPKASVELEPLICSDDNSEEAVPIYPPEEEPAPETMEDITIPEAPAEIMEEVPTWGSWGTKKTKKTRKQFRNFHSWAEPQPEPVFEDLDSAMEATAEAASDLNPANGVVHDRQPTKKETLWKSFISEAEPKSIPPWEPEISSDDNMDFAPVLLAHAKLYAFSDRFEIVSLRELTLERLRLTLARFNLVTQRTNAIVQLLEYAYTLADANTSDSDHTGLRELVVDYVTCHVEIIVQDVMFLNIIQERGSLSKDLVLKLLLRLE